MHFILDPRSNSSEKRTNNRFSNKWILIGIISSIILILTIIIFVVIIICGKSKSKKNQSKPNERVSESIPVPPRFHSIDILI